MRDFVVHSIPGSPFGRAVLMTLEEKGFPYRFAPVSPGAHRQAPYLDKHPFGRIPALDHGISPSTKPRRSCAISTGSCRTRSSRRTIPKPRPAWTSS